MRRSTAWAASVSVLSLLLLGAPAAAQSQLNWTWLRHETTGCETLSGAGSPEGAVVGDVCDVYIRSDGGASTILYIKESGVATNTGWTAVWTTGTGTMVTGSGTIGTLPKFTAASAIGDSLVAEIAGEVNVTGRLDASDTVRATAYTAFADGAGAELGYSGGNAYFTGYNRAGAGSFLPTYLRGDPLYLNEGSTTVVTIDGSAVGIGTAPSANYLTNVAGGISAARTDEQESYPAVYGTHTAATLQDGSAATGTSEAFDSTWEAIKFTASGNHVVRSWSVQLKASAALTNPTATVTGYIYSDVAGAPGASVGGGNTIRYGALTTSFVEYQFAGSATLVSGTAYWIVLKQSDAPTGGTISINTAATGVATHAYSADGVTWTTENAKDGWYKLYGRGHYGVRGASTNSYGGYFTSTTNYGLRGSSNTNIGVYGDSTNYIGVYGSSTNYTGVYGSSTNYAGVYGSSTNSYGVRGISTNGYGVYGASTNNRALYAYRNSATATTAVADIVQDHASDTYAALRVQQDGTGDLLQLYDGATKSVYVSDGGDLTVAVGGLHIGGTADPGDDNAIIDGTLTVATLTATRVPFAGAGGLFTDDADLTFATDTLTATKVVAPTSVSSPLLITAAGPTNMTLQPTGDLVTDPTGNDVVPATNYDITVGALAKKYLALHAAELWVETLVAQDTVATIGGRVIVAPTTMLSADLGDGVGDTTITVKHNQIANGDRIFLESNGKLEFMAVTSAAGGGAGAYTYDVTRDLDGSGRNAWYAGDAVVNTGTTGDGFIDLYSVDGVLSGAGPTIVGNVRTDTDYNDILPVWAIGNLNGLYGYAADTYGVGLGKSDDQNVVIDATDGVRFRSSADVLAQLNGTTWTIGATATEHVSITSTAVQIKDGATVYTDISGGNITVGETGAGKANTYISAGALSLRLNATERIGLTSAGVLAIKNSSGNAVFTFDAADGAEFTLPLTLAATGGIYQGTGTFAAPTTGLKLWNDGGIGRLASYNTSVAQVYFNTDGKLYAGAGNVTLSADGLRLTSSLKAGVPASYVGTLADTGAQVIVDDPVWVYPYTGGAMALTDPDDYIDGVMIGALNDDQWPDAGATGMMGMGGYSPASFGSWAMGAYGGDIVMAIGYSAGDDLATVFQIEAANRTSNFKYSLRSEGSSTPAAGAGIEILYSSGAGYIQSYNRGSSAHVPTYIRGNDLYLQDGTSTIITVASAATAIANVPTTFNAAGGVSIPAQATARYTRTATQSINNTTATTIDWDGNDWELGSVSEAAGSITLPQAGGWMVEAQVYWASSTAGTKRSILIYQDAAEVCRTEITPVNGAFASQATCLIRTADTNDALIVKVYQDSGGALNIGHGASAYLCNVGVTRVW